MGKLEGVVPLWPVTGIQQGTVTWLILLLRSCPNRRSIILIGACASECPRELLTPNANAVCGLPSAPFSPHYLKNSSAIS